MSDGPDSTESDDDRDNWCDAAVRPLPQDQRPEPRYLDRDVHATLLCLWSNYHLRPFVF